MPCGKEYQGLSRSFPSFHPEHLLSHQCAGGEAFFAGFRGSSLNCAASSRHRHDQLDVRSTSESKLRSRGTPMNSSGVVEEH